MKKILLGLVLAGATLQSANAEQSGFFMGAGLGFSGVTLKQDEFGYNSNGGYYDPNNIIRTNNFHYYQRSFDILVGYKQFFTDNFGLRYYVDVAQINQNLINYTLNVDAMYNFFSNNDTRLGAFLGLGLGGITWESGNKDIEEDKFANFDLGLNLGLRALMTEHHSIEIAARVPFNVDENSYIPYQNIGNTYTYDFNIGIRYIFNF